MTEVDRRVRVLSKEQTELFKNTKAVFICIGRSVSAYKPHYFSSNVIILKYHN